MSDYNIHQQQHTGHVQRPLPNSTAVLILGILSILGCCFYGFTGLVLSIITLYLANKDKRLYEMNPGAFTPGSYSNLRAGRVCAIIGIVFSLSIIVFFLVIISMVGVEVLSNPESLQEALENM